MQRPVSRLTSILGLFAVLVTPVSHADIASGLAWLNTTANADGSYATNNDVATPFQSTNESLSAFATVGQPAQPNVAAAIAFLVAEPFNNTENLSRLILTGGQFGTDVVSAETTLATYPNPDGGFGELPGYGSTALDTAFALRSLAGTASTNQIVNNGLFYLVDAQNADGGFPLTAGGPSSPYVSALVAEALIANSATFNVANLLSAVRDYLIGCIDVNGAISDIWQSSLALRVIAPLTANSVAIQPLIDFISQSQAANGSWNDDVYQTALALQALHIAENAVVADPNLLSLGGVVTDRATGVPIVGATIMLDNGALGTVMTNAAGAYQFSNLTVTTATIQIQAPGYLTNVLTATLAPTGLSTLDVTLQADLSPMLLELTGTVIDLSTNQPIIGADITVLQTGDTTTSAADGSFSLADIPAGSLTVEISAAGFANSNLAVSAPLGGLINVGNIGLAPLGGNPTLGSVQGTVHDAENGSPLSNVAITLTGAGSEIVYSDAAGNFLVTDVEPGDVSISVASSGFYPAGASGTVVAGGTLIANFDLVAQGVAAGVSIVGQVVDRETLLPIAGATISVSGTGASTVSDANGQFFFSSISGAQLTITVAASTYVPTTYIASAPDGATINLGIVQLAAADAQPSNEPPVITSVGNTAASVGSNYTYQIIASDPDNDPLTYALSSAPNGVTINSTSGFLSWVPVLEQLGINQISIVVFDDKGGQATQSFDVTVSQGFGSVYVVTDVETLGTFSVDDIVPTNYVLGSYVSGMTPNLVVETPACTLTFSTRPGDTAAAVAALDRLAGQPFTAALGGDLIMNMGTPYGNITVFPQIDHLPLPEEGIEYTVWGADDPNAVFPDGWQRGTLVSIYTQGFVVDPTCPPGTTETDDFAGLYTFGTDSYQYVRVRAANSISLFLTPEHDTWNTNQDNGSAPGWQSEDAEIDAVGGMVCPTPPIVDAGTDILGIVGEPVQFNATAPGQNIVTFGWDFDNDTEIDFVGADASRTFFAGVDSDVTLFAVDDQGCVGTDTVNVRVTVEPAQPDLTITTLDRSSIITDTRTLSTTGYIEATVENIGPAPTGQPATVSAFYDRNSDDDYTIGVDVLLGESVLTESLGEDTEARLTIPVTGFATYRDEIVSVKVDSALAIDEESETNNVATTAGFCRVPVSTDPQLTLIEKWQWFGDASKPNIVDVFGPPAVGQLTDDNGDGMINADDVPDLVFAAREQSNVMTAVFAVSGTDGSPIWIYDAIRVSGTGSVAIGDIDSDGIVEIIVESHRREQLIALEHDGTLKWAVPTGPTFTRDVAGSRDGLSIVDFDGDGSPEIVQGRSVFNADGTLRWVGQGDHGGNITYGVVPIAADVDLDGQPELIAGRTLYDANGNIVWNRTDLVGDGFTAVGNFDQDDFAEIVLVANSRVYLLEHTGETIWGPVSIPGGGIGGPPTVADVDGDGQPEIGVAGASRYIVLESDGVIKWQNVSIDQSSNRTGSSVFDFEFDGEAEVLYADEQNFYIWDGATGAERAKIPNLSGTTLEYPVVVDLDNDNSAEIVLVSSQTSMPGGGGVRVLESGAQPWAATRSIWNQHAYSINNVNDDGTIPNYQEPSWLTHNTFRLNTFLDRDAGALPDLTAALLSISDPQAGQPAAISLRVGNAGGIVADAVTVSVYQGDPGSGGVLLGTVVVGSLEVGEFQDVTLTGLTTLTGTDTVVAIVDAEQLTAECDENNNRVRTQVLLQSSFAAIDVSTSQSIYPAGATVPLDALVSNTTAVPGAFLYQLRVEDSENNQIEAFAQEATGTLAANGSIADSESWESGAVLAGVYQVRGSVFSSEGTLLAEDIASFSIASDPTDPGNNVDAGTQILADKQTYAPFDAILLTARARNLTNNAILPPTIGTVTMLDATGTLLFTGTVNYGELTANSLVDRFLNTTFVDADAGNYTLSLALNDAATGALLATDATTISVVRPATTGLTGGVAAAFSQLERGTDNTCTYDVSNVSSQSIFDLTLNLRVVDFVTGAEVSVESVATSLGGSEVQQLVRTVPTSGLLSETYACILDAEVDSDSVPLGGAPFDLIEPAITVSVDVSLNTGTQGRLLILLDPTNGPDDERTFLETLLTDRGWSYTIVTDKDDFAAEFRSGGYSSYALLSSGVNLSNQVEMELVEAIYGGQGLAIAGNFNDPHVQLQEALGIKHNGHFNAADGADIISSDLFTSFNIQFLSNLKKRKIDIEDATVVGHYTNGGPTAEPSVTLYEFGNGKSVFAGFDVLTESFLAGNTALITEFLAQVIDYPRPGISDVLSGLAIPVTLTVINTGDETPGRALITTNGTLTIADPGLATMLNFSDLEWSFDLAVDETAELTFWVIATDVPGTIEVIVETGEQGDFVEQATPAITLTAIPDAMLQDVLSLAIALEAQDKDFKQIRISVQNAKSHLDSGRLVQGIDKLLAATQRISSQLGKNRINAVDAHQLRLAISVILRQLEQQL